MLLKTSALLAVCVVCFTIAVDAQSDVEPELEAEWEDFLLKYSEDLRRGRFIWIKHILGTHCKKEHM